MGCDSQFDGLYSDRFPSTERVDVSALYRSVGEKFACRVDEALSSEKSLAKLWEDNFPGFPLNQTEAWNVILTRELAKLWRQFGPEIKTELTDYDIQKILRELYSILDYNLFSQVYLNLQPSLFYYATKEARIKMAEMQVAWKDQDLDPFSPKAKLIKEASSDVERRYNMDLSTLKALNLIQQLGPIASYRVSPKGRTPAFADTQNFSMLGAGADRYLRVPQGYSFCFITWTNPVQMIAATSKPGEFEAREILYPFNSQSGGEILNEVLFIRYLLASAYGALAVPSGDAVFIPRLGSLQVVFKTGKQEILQSNLEKKFSNLLNFQKFRSF
jgi:hypothetical protein